MENQNIISWSKNYFLKWTDFKAEINTSAYEDSFSNIRYHHSWTIESEINKGEIYFFISDVVLSTQFLKHLSWVRTQNATLNLLNHEQGHFDLAELLKDSFVERIKNKFNEKKYPTRGQNAEQRKQFAREDSGNLIAKELEKCLSVLSDKRKNYNYETDFGNNIVKQKEYDEKFKKLRT